MEPEVNQKLDEIEKEQFEKLSPEVKHLVRRWDQIAAHEDPEAVSDAIGFLAGRAAARAFSKGLEAMAVGLLDLKLPKEGE